MNKELKDVLQLLAMVLPLFAFMMWGWFLSPMYTDVKVQQRLNVQGYLNETYYFTPDPYIDRAGMMEYYRITDEEINTEKILRNLATKRSVVNNKTLYDVNLGGSK